LAGYQGARRARQAGIAVVLAMSVLLAACGSSSKSGGGAAATTSSSTLPSATTLPPSTALGIGVTANTVKVGVALVDFSCIEQFTDTIRENQQQIYGDFIKDINQHGGVAGRQIDPIYKTYCPLGSAAPLSICTQLTQDEKVFAVIGTFIDFSGDAQTCVAKQNHTVLMTFNLTNQIINRSPGGLMVFPGTTPERVSSIMFGLMKTAGTLNGKKVAAMGDTSTAQIVNGTIVPGLKSLGVPTGSTAILSVGTTGDTTQAQAQLDSFIERWKAESVNAVFMSGDLVSAKQFVQKLRAQMPNVTLLVDTTDVLEQAQQIQQTNPKTNPYEGIITAGGPVPAEYDASANWQKCSSIYQQQTGQVAPNAASVIHGPNGKLIDTYGTINDACQVVNMFKDIGNKVGKYLDNTNWINAVNTFGPITNLGGGQYASLIAGKYDVDDTHRLEEYDSTVGATGNWKAMTPLQNVTGL
jgi:hypothetical protein